MNHTKIKTDLIKSTFNLLRPEDGLYSVFKKGSISIEYKSGIIASMTSPIAFFDGALDSYLFSKLGGLPKHYLHLRVINHTVKIKSGDLHISLYFAPAENHDVGIDLWSRSIKWYPCRQDIVKGICCVADSLPETSNYPIDAENLVHSLIHIVDGYVIALDQYCCRASRYKLSAPPPFNISLSPIGIKQAFGRIKNRKLLRVGQAKIQNGEKVHRGITFDFGDIRVCVPGIDVNDRSTCEGQRGGIIHYGRNWIMSTVSRLLSIPCEFILTIPADLKNFPPQIKGIQGNDDFMTLILMKDKIRLHHQVKNILVREKTISTKINIPNYPIKIQVNPLHFTKALIDTRLMGLIKTSEGRFFLYFKNKMLEHFIAARPYIKEEEVTCHTKKKPK